MSAKTWMLVGVLMAATLAGCASKSPAGGTSPKPDCSRLIQDANGSSAAHTKVAIETSKGTFKAELFDDASPVTAKNFRSYVEEKYFDHVVYHRLIKGFMMQGGKFENETMKAKTPTHPAIVLEASSSGCLNKHYTLSMARTGDPNSAQTEFFVNYSDNTFLDPTGPNTGYAVFGIVYEGREVVDMLEKTPVHMYRGASDTMCQGGDQQPSCPDSPQEMKSVTIV